MENPKNISFEEYLKIKGISVSSEPHPVGSSDITEEIILEQFKLISKFHTIASDYNGFDLKNIENKTGRLIEKYKVEIRSLKRYVNNINGLKNLNEADKYILEHFEETILRSENSIDAAMNIDYIKLIRRSMINNEICLGNSFFDNIYACTGGIKIKELDDICFNMIEMDCIYIIGKLKNRKLSFDFEKLIKEYVSMEKLDEDSEVFIKALASYPAQYMKWFKRYLDRNGDFKAEDYLIKLTKAAKKDGKSII